jgi:hypothetical protein
LKRIRSRLSYANVVSTLALFLVLGGSAALAATELEPNSVGTVQLKPQAVTAVKIKREAVIASRIDNGAVIADKLAAGAVVGDKLADGVVGTGKLAAGAVTSERIADGAVTTGKIANGSVTPDKLSFPIAPAPVSQIAARLRETAAVEFPRTTNPPQPRIPYPSTNLVYTQPPGETDQFLAQFQVTFPASCTGRRRATASLFIDAPADPDGRDFVGTGEVDDEGTAEVTRTGYFSLGDANGRSYSLAPGSPIQQKFSVELDRASCGNFTNGVKMTGVQIDVIGIR